MKEDETCVCVGRLESARQGWFVSSLQLVGRSILYFCQALGSSTYISKEEESHGVCTSGRLVDLSRRCNSQEDVLNQKRMC